MSLPSGSATGVLKSRGSLRLKAMQSWAETSQSPEVTQLPEADLILWFTLVLFSSLEGLRSRKPEGPSHKTQWNPKGFPTSARKRVSPSSWAQAAPLSSLEIPLGQAPLSIPPRGKYLSGQAFNLSFGQGCGETQGSTEMAAPLLSLTQPCSWILRQFLCLLWEQCPEGQWVLG